LTPLDFVRDLTNVETLRSNFDLNITSFVFLSSAFMRVSTQKFPKAQCFIVNISSLAAIKAFSSWGVYCMGKAAREMMMMVITEEVCISFSLFE
jgi:sepiapterin reductase